MATTRERAFTPWQWNTVRARIVEAKARALTHMRHGIKTQTLFDVFVHDEDKEPLQRVFKICDVNTSHQSLLFKTNLKNVEIENLSADLAVEFSITIEPHSKFKFLLPKYLAKAQIQKDVPELKELFYTLGSIHLEWARVHNVLQALDNDCRTLSQVKTVCPHLAALLNDGSDDARKLGERLFGMNDTDRIPALPLDLRKHALEIGQTITKSLLIPTESEKDEDEFVAAVSSIQTKKNRWDGLPWSFAMV